MMRISHVVAAVTGMTLAWLWYAGSNDPLTWQARSLVIGAGGFAFGYGWELVRRFISRAH